MSFYIYRKIRKFSCLIKIIAEIHIVDIFKSKMLIAIDIVNIKKIFINFRIRTLVINIIPEFSANIRAIRRNIKIIKIVVNSRKKEIIPSNIIKKSRYGWERNWTIIAIFCSYLNIRTLFII
jgi:hypothetical protein